jgi:hypothetical protein
MKLDAIYFTSEPDSLDCDSIDMRVLVKADSGESVGREYAFEATTLKYITAWMQERGKKYYCGAKAPVLIVERLDADTVEQAVKDILPHIDSLGLKTD